MNRICIVGDILVDVSLKSKGNPLKMRLGGIVHAARCLWAMDIEYSIAYFAPSYLDVHIHDYLINHGCSEIIKLGNIDNCPYLMLIEEVKEIGDQGYDFVLRDDVKISYYDDEIKKLAQYEDLFFISGNYDYSHLAESVSVNGRIHFDIANNVRDLSFLKTEKKIETIFLSTSSNIFADNYDPDSFSVICFFDLFKPLSKRVILKENRGGSRAFDFDTGQLVQIPSQTQKIKHSVGVGDVYDVVYIALSNSKAFSGALNYSSWIATEYAKTTYPSDFKSMVLRILNTPIPEIVELGGCILPWECRRKCHIYIAAPDFNFINRSPIDILENSLLYHNFTPHRPIKENGQMEENANWSRKQELFVKDMALLDKCNMLIAVLLYNDPGTLIEIGLAAEKKIPTIVYDPFCIAKNCMLTQLPDLVSSDLDEIISEVFCLYSKTFTSL